MLDKWKKITHTRREKDSISFEDFKRLGCLVRSPQSFAFSFPFFVLALFIRSFVGADPFIWFDLVVDINGIDRNDYGNDDDDDIIVCLDFQA